MSKRRNKYVFDPKRDKAKFVPPKTPETWGAILTRLLNKRAKQYPNNVLTTSGQEDQ